VQTCSRCSTQSADHVTTCPQCQADLREHSVTAVALKGFISNPRVTAVRISVAGDACPACQSLEGVYPKDKIPTLPAEGCSKGCGCRCFYAPILDRIYP
jgi:hypothetical protein